jgi:hypothetical protein
VHLPPKGIVTVRLYRKVGLNIIHSGGWSHKGLPYGSLEPYEGKLSRPVLRGLGAGNSPRLPGFSGINFPLLNKKVIGVARMLLTIFRKACLWLQPPYLTYFVNIK